MSKGPKNSSSLTNYMHDVVRNKTLFGNMVTGIS